jgi:hypothetical protein
MTNAAIEAPLVDEVIVPEHQVTWEITKTNDANVDVTFTCAITEITHDRSVNTFDCVDDDAVQVRLSEVARGVHNKICVGAITAQVDEPEEDPAPAGEEE